MQCSSFKSFRFRDWGRLEYGGWPIFLKIRTQSPYADLCTVPISASLVVFHPSSGYQPHGGPVRSTFD